MLSLTPAESAAVEGVWLEAAGARHRFGGHTVEMPQAQVLTTAEATADLLRAIRALLDEAFAGDFSPDDWQHTIGGFHAILAERGVVLAHGAAVPRALEVDGRRLRAGYVEGVATAPARQGQGLGTLVMVTLAGVLQREFEIGALSTGHHNFYARLGWQRWRGPTHVRHAEHTVRTAQEDGGIMVLLYGSSEGVDLSASITCEARSGDDW